MKTILAQLNEISTKLDELDLIKFADIVDEVMQKVATTPEQQLLDLNTLIGETEKDEGYYEEEAEKTQNIRLPKMQQTVLEKQKALQDMRKQQKEFKNKAPEQEPQQQTLQTTPTAPAGLGGNRLMV